MAQTPLFSPDSGPYERENARFWASGAGRGPGAGRDGTDLWSTVDDWPGPDMTGGRAAARG
eukprot:scaffold2926_cov399-Prasinococcus_capsulatus_cf.AAC.2